MAQKPSKIRNYTGQLASSLVSSPWLALGIKGI
jgi:hypothetical protein